MTRPEKIYLEEPVEIKGIKVIDHYQTILKISTPQQLKDVDRQHIELMIKNYNIHLELYKTQNNIHHASTQL